MQIRQVEDIEYCLLEGSERTTTDIVLERDGSLHVRAPKQMGPEQVDEVVRSKRMWIYKNLSEWRELNRPRRKREMVSGESFLYLGRKYQLAIVAEQSEALRFHEGRFWMRRDVIEQGRAKEVFEQFYINKGFERLSKRVKEFAKKVGMSVSKISVKELGYRWASCGSNGNMNFHWKCMMAPGKVLDYIIVHELCHLHVRDHDERFWNEVDKVLPNYRECKEWLRSNGAALEL